MAACNAASGELTRTGPVTCTETVLPSYLADPMVDSGELVPVLTSFLPTGQTLQAVYPHRRHLAGKVRALIDHLVEWFATHPIS